MSRNFIPVALAIGVGVYTGYYTFQPAFQQLAIEKTQGTNPDATPQSAAGSAPAANGAPANANPQNPKPVPGTANAEKNQ